MGTVTQFTVWFVGMYKLLCPSEKNQIQIHEFKLDFVCMNPCFLNFTIPLPCCHPDSDHMAILEFVNCPSFWKGGLEKQQQQRKGPCFLVEVLLGWQAKKKVFNSKGGGGERGADCTPPLRMGLCASPPPFRKAYAHTPNTNDDSKAWYYKGWTIFVSLFFPHRLSGISIWWTSWSVPTSLCCSLDLQGLAKRPSCR